MMNLKKVFVLGLSGALPLSAHAQTSAEMAQRGLPFVRPSDQKKLVEQSDGFFKVLDPISEPLGKYAVNVFSNGKMVSRGTLVEAGVLTKWSELVGKGSQIWVVGNDGAKRPAKVVAVYLEYDMALLDYGGGLAAVEDVPLADDPDLGAFLMAVGPSGKAHGLGVMSVAERSLRETDKAFLGVRMGVSPVPGGGVLLEYVEPDTAAGRGGLVAGDVVKRIDQTDIDGMHEMSSYLQKLRPGTKVEIEFSRNGASQLSDVILGSRPDRKRFDPQRMKTMRRMGGSINGVGDGFPEILQSDMQIDATDAGSPIFDIDGKFVGVVAARSSRIKTYIVQADDLFATLQQEPDKSVAGFNKPASTSQTNLTQSPERQQLMREKQELVDMIERAGERLRQIELELQE